MRADTKISRFVIATALFATLNHLGCASTVGPDGGRDADLAAANAPEGGDVTEPIDADARGDGASTYDPLAPAPSCMSDDVCQVWAEGRSLSRVAHGVCNLSSHQCNSADHCVGFSPFTCVCGYQGGYAVSCPALDVCLSPSAGQPAVCVPACSQ